MHENRETSGASRANRDRSGKANNHKPDRHAPEESDDAIVLMKPPNKEAQASAEVVEGRARGKENISSPHTCPTQRGTQRVPGGRPVCGGQSCADRYYPSQEPYAVVPLVRICAGGAG